MIAGAVIEKTMISRAENLKATGTRYGVYDLLLYLCPIVFMFAAWLPVMALGRFVLLLLLSALLWTSLVLHKEKLARNPVAIGLAILACYSIATSFLSYYPTISLLKAISLLLLSGFLLLMTPAIERLHPSLGAKEYMLRMYLYFGIAVVLSNAAYYFINPSSSNDISGVYAGTSLLGGRFRGWFLNPNSVGAMYGMFFVPILWYAAGKHRWGLAKLGLLATLLIAGIELLASQSRAGILAGLASLLVLVLGRKKWAPSMAILGIGLLALAIHIENPQENIVRNFLYRNEVQLQGSDRLPVWTETWNRFLANPVFGSGLGISETGSRPESLAVSSEGYTIEKGNSYLGALEELGLFGVAILLAALFTPILRASWKSPRTVDSRRYEPNLILIAIVVAGLVNAAFEAWLLSVGSIFGFSFWVFAALLSSPESKVGKR